MDSATTSKGECPVCLQIPRDQIFQCGNGHSVCDICSTKVTICPVCRSLHLKIRNRLAENLLNDMKFKCCWSEQGCNKMTPPCELSAHDDTCEMNPLSIKLCSYFGENCEYKFTRKWLSQHRNCTEFINHIKTHGYTCEYNMLNGERYVHCISWDIVQPGVKLDSTKLAHSYIKPRFFRLRTPNKYKKEQLFFRAVFLREDNAGRKLMSWIWVQLTPELTPIDMMVLINGNENSTRVSKCGQNSAPTLNWIVKSISFNGFMKLVQISQNSGGNETQFPFSLPVSLLSEYYIRDDKKLCFTLNFRISRS